ncbi:MAG: tRNA (adenosine(37)-N6)-dimethylallyltransferase MiaA [Rhodobacteraceae bacterium]|nr:tRNA (adenosine(37)-N6)-dimethylallyltransferase MiaA [Paracoccaceae bacterium]
MPQTIAAGRPVLIAGPTASGKSALALQLAETQGGVIVNADALQVYGCWRILTARPGPDDEARAPHLLYGHIGRDQPYSVGHWLREVAAILASGKRPIIVGGTGLYFTALTEGLAEIPPTPPEVRAEADALRAAQGTRALLATLDPATAARIDTANPARVQRAWEVLRATGRGLADWQAETGAPVLPLAAAEAVVMHAPADRLAPRIDRRFDAMMAAGALDEVRAELPFWQPARASARAIGAPELVAHLQGDLPLDAAIAAAKIATRQYAKRQRTWFRSRMHNWRAIELG